MVDGRRQVLTHFEFELLPLLARAAGRVLSREQLMDALKGEEFESFDWSIDVHVSKLRAKIEPDPEAPALHQDGARRRLRVRAATAGEMRSSTHGFTCTSSACCSWSV